MAAPSPRCIKFTVKTKYSEQDDCDDLPDNLVCVNSTYNYKATAGDDVTAFLTAVLTGSFPNSAAPIAAYYSALYDALVGVNALNFSECKQFSELDANGAAVPDGYNICICMSHSHKRKRVCVCDDGCETKKCHC